MRDKSTRGAIACCLFLILISSNGYCLKEDTHTAIDQHIVQYSINVFSLDDYLRTKLGFVKGNVEPIKGANAHGVNEIKSVTEWLGYGGFMEDAPSNWWNFLPWVSDTRGKRHFHNPLEPNWSNAGLNDIYSGMPSIVVWAQTDDQDPKHALYGSWSWQNVRNYFFSALTSVNNDARADFFAKTFRGVGQQMHIIQDASVPEHVRNDAHILEGYEKYVDEDLRKATLWLETSSGTDSLTSPS